MATTSDYDVFVFGDSLSDTGNSFRLTNGAVPPSPPYFEGRFSNGPVAVETVAERLGLDLEQDTNFAVGGATTGRINNNDNLIPGLELDGLLDQIDKFKAQASALGAGAEDLYVIWAGANDFLSQPANPNLAVQTAVTNLTNSVLALAQSGAKQIVVAKTPNLGRVPASLDAGLLSQLTTLSIGFNAALESALTALQPQLGGATVILTDLFATSESIAQNPSAFGFTNTTTPFLNGLVPADPAADPNTFFFWDRIHPTTKSHGLFADTFVQSIINGITTPINRRGDAEADRLVGYSGNDRLAGRAGDDAIDGNPGDDTLLGGQGNDTLTGGDGNDILRCGGGRDRAFGSAGADQLFGNGENDRLEGGAGDDLLAGGRGINRLKGDEGKDTFSLQRGGRAIILDFTANQDVMQLTRSLTFEDLTLVQRGSNAQVRLDSSGEILAILRGTQATAIDGTDFVTSS